MKLGVNIYQQIIKKTKKNSNLATLAFIFLLLNIISLFILFKVVLKNKDLLNNKVFFYIYFSSITILLLSFLIIKIIAFINYLQLLLFHKKSSIFLKKNHTILIWGLFFEVVNHIAIARIASRAMLYLRLKDNLVYKVKDIVLIAIMAIAAIMFSGVMPLVIPLLTKIFGIAQLATALPTAFFFSITIEKLKKPYALIIMSSFMSLVLLPMNWIMSLIFIIPAVIIELFNIVFIKGYQKSTYVFASVATMYPLSLLLFYYLLVVFNDSKANLIYNYSSIPVIIATIFLSYLGVFLGVRVVREITRVKERRTKNE